MGRIRTIEGKVEQPWGSLDLMKKARKAGNRSEKMPKDRDGHPTAEVGRSRPSKTFTGRRDPDFQEPSQEKQ